VKRKLLLGVLVLPVLTGCEWFTDFKNQPKIEPWESASQNPADSTAPRGQPQLSVPVSAGTSMAASYGISYAALPSVIDSFSVVPNPEPVTEQSLAMGRMHYQINCAVCHGDKGDGNGSLKAYNPAYGFAPSIIGDGTKARKDGYVYGMLRNGRGLMGSYNRIEERDRWHVVNYVRALQGLTAIAPQIGPVGKPGENGTTVPRASLTAPSRPATVVLPDLTRGMMPGPKPTEAPHGPEAAPAAGEAGKPHAQAPKAAAVVAQAKEMQQ
jgi:mono/diheme cytochrome c family protein